MASPPPPCPSASAHCHPHHSLTPPVVLANWHSTNPSSPTVTSSQYHSYPSTHSIPPLLHYEEVPPTPYLAAIPTSLAESMPSPCHITSCVAADGSQYHTRRNRQPPTISTALNVVWAPSQLAHRSVMHLPVAVPLTSEYGPPASPAVAQTYWPLAIPPTPHTIWILVGLHVGQRPIHILDRQTSRYVSVPPSNTIGC